MFKFAEAKAAVESEGVHVGGWSLRQAIWPRREESQIGISTQTSILLLSKKKTLTKHEEQAENVTVVVDWTPEAERALVRKLDWRVLFPCCILYFLAYLDRANLGFVGVLRTGTPDNMQETLHLKGIQFNWAISVTYFMVTTLLIPSNLLMKKISGKNYFPLIMILFGGIVCCIAAVQNDAGLLAARFFLGVPEAGVVPATIMYFSFWYKPSERAFRIGIFHASNSLASGVGGFIANGVDKVSYHFSKIERILTVLLLNGRAGLESWRWLFIIEGLMPIVMAVPVYFLLLTFPETSKALSERGKSLRRQLISLTRIRKTHRNK